MSHCGNLADVLNINLLENIRVIYYSLVRLLYLFKFEICYLTFVCEMQLVVLFNQVYNAAS
jgi:hypothetical protein